MKRKKYNKELKSKVALAAIKGNQTVSEITSEFGIHIRLVNRWKKEATEALPLVFGKSQAKQAKATEIERDRLYQKVGKLQAEQETPENIEIMRFTDKEYTDHPFCGTRQMRNVLRRKGYKINRKQVQRLMRKMGIQSIAPKPNTRKAHPRHKIYPYFLRNFDVTREDQVWCTDLTYIRLAGGFVYLTAVMDWHSRYVLSRELSVTMDNEFCVSALERALRCHGTPYMFNTDQGSQYTSHEFTKLLKDKDIKISMDGKGRCMDNIFIDRLWRSVKYEEIYVNEFQSVKQLRKSLKKYFYFYNHERPHQSFNGQTPAEIYYGKNQLRLVG